MASSGRGMKRRAPVRCAAANDEDDLGGLFDAARERAEASSSSAPAGKDAERGAAEKEKPRRKKAKEFAWMDSDDDVGDDGDSAGGEEQADSPTAAGETEELQQPVTVKALDEVQSFGRMMLLSDALRVQIHAGSFGPDELASTCRALARTKFFDREVLDDVYKLFKNLLKEDKLDPGPVNDAVQCMFALNAYDADFFSTIARCYLNRVGELEAGMRSEWLDIFRHFNHNAEPGFLQLLETPPVAPIHPNYKRVRCRHHSRGACAMGDACTYSHDPRAPLSLADNTKEDWWKLKASVMMTQNQKCMGNGSYGTGPLGVDPM